MICYSLAIPEALFRNFPLQGFLTPHFDGLILVSKEWRRGCSILSRNQRPQTICSNDPFFLSIKYFYRLKIVHIQDLL
jgi:hypothetical protein